MTEVFESNDKLDVSSDVDDDEELDELDEIEPGDEVLNHISVGADLSHELPKGARAIVMSDLHLSPSATPQSLLVANQVAEVLAEVEGPGAFILAGGTFDLPGGEDDIAAVLAAHPRFTKGVKAFAEEEGRDVILLVGGHGGLRGLSDDNCDVVVERLGVSSIGWSCDLTVQTDRGPQLVHVSHTPRLSERSSMEDVFGSDDLEHGRSASGELTSELEFRQGPGSLFEGVRWLDGDIADFVGSRLFYRKIIGWLWLLAIPFAAFLLATALTGFTGIEHVVHRHGNRWLLLFLALTVQMVIVAAIAAGATLFRVNRSLRSTANSVGGASTQKNATARANAARLIAKGYAGVISGKSHAPELSVVSDGFYANAGNCTESVTARPARLRLPSPYVNVQRFSYVELIGGTSLESKLWLRETADRPPVLFERLALSKLGTDRETLAVVAQLPTGPVFPLNATGLAQAVRRQRVRIAAEVIVVLSAITNIVFTLLWNVHSTRRIDRWLPFGIHPMSLLESIVVSLALLGLARGLRRGLRPVWIATLAAFALTTLDRLMLDHWRSVGSTLAVIFCLWLIVEQRHFRVEPRGIRRVFVWFAAAGLAAIAGIIGIGRVVGFGHSPTGGIITAVILVTVVLVLLSAMPGRDQRRTGTARREAFDRALKIIETYGGDTLDYFALRDDKTWFFTGNSLVAYSVINGVMLISPDPIGPTQDRADVWSDVLDLADSKNWSVTVLAASESWLPIYRASGLSDFYIGDEAIVDAATFSLAGKQMKSLRGAYNRIEKAGYHVECFDALAQISEDLQAQLLELMTETRQGEAERGFSMTLSRIFDPRDEGLLLAVCFDADHRPVAFNQYIPATFVNGYSLDLMRRTADEDAPNGLTDFVIIQTLQWMAERSLNGLGLNFATMRAVVAGETGEGTFASLERSVLHYFSESMQIESLWRFNKKYEPYWNPRYVVTSPYLPLARSSLAIARAEGVTEMPVIGPLLRTKAPAPGASR